MIHLILGRQGSGKTLFMAKLARKAHELGKKVYSNIAFNFPYEPLDYKDIIECNLKDSYVFIDEIHLLLPARLSLRKINIEICDNFLSMARKQNTEIFGTTQTARKVDIRFREEADYVYKLKKYAYLSGRWLEVMHNVSYDPEVQIMIECEMLNMNQVSDGAAQRTGRLKFIANEYYDLYDTYQVIKIRNLPTIK